MNTTAAFIPTHPRKFNLQPLFTTLGKAGRTTRRVLNGAAWGAAAGGIAGAMLGMAIFAWSLNTPIGKFIDLTVSALIILVVISTLGGCAVLAFALLRAGLQRLAARPQRPLRKIAALPQFITGLLPLPLVFIGAGLALASQLYAWFPKLIFYFLTLRGPVIPIVLIEVVLGMLAGIILTFRSRLWPVRLLAFLPAAGLNLRK